MTKSEIKTWFTDRGYKLSLKPRTVIMSEWYRVGDSNKIKWVEEGCSSRPYDYEWLYGLILDGREDRLNVW